MSCSRTQHGGGRYRTPDLSLRSPTLYHWATALPTEGEVKMYRTNMEIQNLDQNFSLKSWKCRKTSPCLKALGLPLEDSDQTRQMLRLIQVFAGCTGHFVGFVMLWFNNSISMLLPAQPFDKSASKCKHTNLTILPKVIKHKLHTHSFSSTQNATSAKWNTIDEVSWPTNDTTQNFKGPDNMIYELPHNKTNKTACAPSEDSDQPGHPLSLRCPHEETMGPQLCTERTVKTLIRLGRCPGWSES